MEIISHKEIINYIEQRHATHYTKRMDAVFFSNRNMKSRIFRCGNQPTFNHSACIVSI